MSIQKKSLISALKTTKKANVASTEVAKGEKMSSMRKVSNINTKSASAIHPRSVTNFKKGAGVVHGKAVGNFKKVG